MRKSAVKTKGHNPPELVPEEGIIMYVCILFVSFREMTILSDGRVVSHGIGKWVPHYFRILRTFCNNYNHSP